MKRYIKSAVNVSDIEAKIAKKQAEINKKKAWIAKKEANIQTKLQLLSTELDSATYHRLVTRMEYLKNNRRYSAIPEEADINTWQLARDHGWDYESKLGKACYSIDDDAESIHTSKQAIEEIQGIIDNYEAKISALRAKDAEIDRIPDCLKDFMNEIVERWDEYDIKLRDESEPYYWELKHQADALLYEGNPTRSYKVSEEKLAQMYPDIEYSYKRSRKFEEEYVENPFRHKFGQSIQYARSFWGMTDEQIHEDNLKSGKSLILDLLKRVTKITGPVRDWKGLELTRGNMGSVLNGVVIGEDGKARVESILAGGYNIQRLHVRTLVKPIK